MIINLTQMNNDDPMILDEDQNIRNTCSANIISAYLIIRD